MSVPTVSEPAPPKKQWVLRLLVLVLASAGALSAGLLGSITLSDLPRQREQTRRIESVRGQDANTISQKWTDLNRQEVTSYFLMGAAGIGLLCAYFTTVDRRGVLSGLLLLSAVAAIPILTLDQDTLLRASPLLPAGLLSLLVWRRRRGAFSWGTIAMTLIVGLFAVAIPVAAALGRSQPELFVVSEDGKAAPPATRPGAPNKGERPNRPPSRPPVDDSK